MAERKKAVVEVTAKARARAEASELAVGSRLKQVREAAGLSQRELAKRAGVTNATVSTIEQETHAPSLASLHRLLTAIPISIADFFALPVSQKNALFYNADDLAVVSRGAADLRVLGSERRDKRLQMFIERYKPGAGTGDDPIIYDGETAVLVIEGTIEVEVGGETYRLRKGGGYQLFGRVPYWLRNVGKTEAVVACACTPPIF
ncbi:helix-turn-helix domain-containing protein [Hyphomicrobium sp. ghe19]|uniref:helix-turn-helix domain-containing protein n=1 Tax=Hyphomicrobium sp. ghe19 TaxID=2682968 RepID=UPI0013676E17|nr:HTH-type transcriptional regulator PuuR [Hyphomicrobium sp. ghe19]